MNTEKSSYTHIIGDYYFSADTMSVNLAKRTISKKGKAVGEERYSIIGYYPNLEMCLRRLVEEMQKDGLSTATDLADALRIVRQSNEDVKQAILTVVGRR